ncbi:ABC transporter permease [Natrialba swarupiae]|uniref:ABC transporter permease n=1 Tax=Natrialba swarupiae TaxID=2448032 RepID=A0A5D5AGD3_9EURY|nr:ABC transporter permease [Natrialba swarupiae]MCW8172406.1 ABC transporter permease [Natrialba swarupiae]TYT60826.1 ABC transporter permease [Natrialba swarupiae]
MTGQWNWRAVKLVSALVYVSMFVPLLVVVVNSFHPQRMASFPPSSLTLHWYGEFFADQMLLDAVWMSTKVGVATAICAGAVGTLSAMGFVRKQFPVKKGLVIVMLSPMLVPPVIVGLASTMFFTELGWERSILWLVTMHTLIALPYAFLIVRSRLFLFDESLEEAAQTLGADHLTTFREVTFPIISPAILTAMIISFVISFGEFTATQFWVSRETTTAPVVIYTMLETLITPKVNVLATLVLVITIAIPIAGMALQRWLASPTE